MRVLKLKGLTPFGKTVQIDAMDRAISHEVWLLVPCYSDPASTISFFINLLERDNSVTSFSFQPTPEGYVFDIHTIKAMAVYTGFA